MKENVYQHKEKLILESGEQLEDLSIAYTTYGTLAPDGSNVIWICHALTANADPAEWWPGLVGDGRFYNPTEHFIVCANVLSSCYGTTGPASKNTQQDKTYFWEFPQVTIRDMVLAHELLRQHLGIQKIHTLIGGSLGGMQVLEWTISHPELFKHVILLATNARHSAWGIAFNESQRLAIKADPTWNQDHPNAGTAGLKAARSIALLSYRGYETYDRSQTEDDLNKIDHYKASSYQNYQGEKLVNRFSSHSYWYLTKAMDSHNVGRGRGNVEQTLKAIQNNTLVIGISSDILFPVSEQKYLAEKMPNATYQEIDSFYGHDGFLIETEHIEELIRTFYNK
ncbi:MAG TPA: homoserine O-acetyltransferase [Cytophagaceae bacterium]|jgi:homoserine O-acetyltransferase|nr:homoserine O-acetyltransferase [Cytophagaceae bacterium]